MYGQPEAPVEPEEGKTYEVIGGTPAMISGKVSAGPGTILKVLSTDTDGVRVEVTGIPGQTDMQTFLTTQKWEALRVKEVPSQGARRRRRKTRARKTKRRTTRRKN